MINVKRIYEKVEKRDGDRFLVDRLWPRGVRREDVKLDAWIKEVAPSDQLRKWFGHDPKKWREFKDKYFKELKTNHSVFEIINRSRQTNVTLLYGAKDDEHNNAVALKEFIEKRFR